MATVVDLETSRSGPDRYDTFSVPTAPHCHNGHFSIQSLPETE